MRFLASFFAGYLKLTLYLQYPCIRCYLGQDLVPKRAKCREHIDGWMTSCRKWPFLVFGAPVAKYGWIIKKIGTHPQQTIIYDICFVFIKILIFVALMRDFRVIRVRPAADLRATSAL